MKRMKIPMTILLIVTSLIILSVIRAESFESEAISQVSQGVAEWRLLNEEISEPQTGQAVYVSSSLRGVVDKGNGKQITIVQGLVAFDNNDYSSRLPVFDPLQNIYSLSKQTTIYGIGQYVAKEYGQIGSQIFSSGTMIISTAGKAADTFIKTVDYVGKSMQVMNPPVYLKEKTSWGWRGEGSYSLPDGQVHYKETLITGGNGPITRTHTDWVTTNTGNYIRHVEIKTPAANNFERFMMHRFPVGGYFDAETSTITTIARSQQSYRIETVGGISKVTLLPSSGIGNNFGGVGSNNWNSLPPTFHATAKTIEIGSMAIKYPSIDWTRIPKTTWAIPHTNPLPTVRPSIPPMTVYPTLPSSSWRRKY